ncbi:MAG TPA: Flp pilus assembly protein CpaB [Isosphaeraceae bacterium]|jgi:pilus assembly protein CpaB|nr:Flp pilus assembly protein CpaB [Isosphaeraceae bacterium]
MRGRSGLLLALAVASGLGAMYGANKLLSKGAKGGADEVSVLVAARDLPIEDVLKEADVRVAKLPRASVPAGALTDPKQVEDRWVMVKLFEGEPIVEAKLAPKGSPSGLVARIPKGMRALAIEVNESTGVSGFVLPGHRVDVIQTKPDGGNRRGPGQTTEADTILENVLVLASGQTLTRPEDKSINVRTVTLAVTPDEADLLVAARLKGPLSLSLRGLNDSVSRPRPKPTEPEGQPIVVARRDLRPQELIDSNLIELKPFPKGLAPPRSFNALADAEGRRVRVPIFAGEPVLEGKVTAKGAPAEPEGQPVVIARRDLVPDQLIDPEFIEVKPFPKELVPVGGFNASGDVEGRYVREKIHAGEPIVEGRLLPRGTSPEEIISLSKRLGKGMRPFVVIGDAAKNGVGPHLKPESRVDVLCTSEVTISESANQYQAGGTLGSNAANTTATRRTAKSELLIEDVRVLDSEKAKGVEGWAVVLEVPFELMDDLTAARASGTLTLALRADGDHERAAVIAEAEPEFFMIHKGLQPPEQVRLRPKKPRDRPRTDDQDGTPPRGDRRTVSGVRVLRGAAP